MSKQKYSFITKLTSGKDIVEYDVFTTLQALSDYMGVSVDVLYHKFSREKKTEVSLAGGALKIFKRPLRGNKRSPKPLK